MKDAKITDEDREYFGTDSKRFFERALLNSQTWEDGTKYARELKTLQHPSLASVQSKNENVTAIELRWSRPNELKSNELESVTVISRVEQPKLTDVVEKVEQVVEDKAAELLTE